MKILMLLLSFLTLASAAQAQVRLYGQYNVGDTKNAVSSYDRTMRLNGMYYYIEPHFNTRNELYKVRIINYDYVVLADYQVVLKHAERLVELMEYNYGPAGKGRMVTNFIRCNRDTPYSIANWKLQDKDVQIDIECKDGNYLHIVFSITAHNFSTEKRPQKIQGLVEN